MSQTQVTEKKMAPRRAATTTKPARPAVTAKAATKSVMQHVAGAAVKFFVFVEGARPVSGPRLSAHTDAAMRFLGMADQQPVRKAAAVAVMGARAVKYHLERGNLKEKADQVMLTTQGYQFFAGRVESGKVDGKLSSAYLAAIKRGKSNTEFGIKDNHLIPVGMSLR